MRQETSRIAALRALASMCITEVLLPWHVDSDAALIRAVLTIRRPAVAIAVASMASACGAFTTATIMLRLRGLLLITEQPFAALGEITVVVWLCQFGAFITTVAAASPRAPLQAAVLLAALGEVAPLRIGIAVLAGRALKCSVVAHCTLTEPAWLKSLGLGDALTRARCGGASVTLLPT